MDDDEEPDLEELELPELDGADSLGAVPLLDRDWDEGGDW